MKMASPQKVEFVQHNMLRMEKHVYVSTNKRTLITHHLRTCKKRCKSGLLQNNWAKNEFKIKQSQSAQTAAHNL